MSLSRSLSLAVMAMALCLPAPPLRAAGDNGELALRVRAAFLFNFARYTSWPPQRLQEILSFCIVGNSSMLPVLQQTVSGKTIDGLLPEVRIAKAPEDLQNCHIVYIDKPSDDIDWASALRTQGGLTVGEGRDFAGREGIVGFFEEQDRLRFAIATDRLDEAALQMSSRLLNLAQIVSRPKP